MISYSLGTYGFIQKEKIENPPLFLLDLGIESRQNEEYYYHNLDRPSFNGYLFQYTLKGKGIYEVNGTSYELSPGNGFLLKIPEDSSYYLPAGSNEHWEYFYLHFDGTGAEFFYHALRNYYGPIVNLPRNNPPFPLFFKLHETLLNQETLGAYEGGEFLYRFFSGLLRQLEAPSLESIGFIGLAADYMKKNYSQMDGIAQAAAHCQVSQSHLTRCFQAQLGTTPLNYLLNIRLENAIFLLLNTEDSVDSIARSCGFSCGNYFSKVFRKHMKVSPMEYRSRG